MDELLTYFYSPSKKAWEEICALSHISANTILSLTKKYPEAPIRSLLTLKEIHIKLKKKIPLSSKYLFTQKGAEQASSTVLAQYHGKKFASYKTLADLCCGCGMDLLFLSLAKTKVFAVDLDPLTLKTAIYNCFQTGLTMIEPLCSRAEDFHEQVDAVFADPDRRALGKRGRQKDEMSPTLPALLSLRYENMAIKLSPLFDFANLPLPDATYEFVSEDGELKEILLCRGSLATENVLRKAVVLPQHAVLTDAAPGSKSVAFVREYLFEPDASVIRAALVEQAAYLAKANFIDAKIALLTAGKPVVTAFGKWYKVKEVFPQKLKTLNNYLVKNEIGIVDIKTRGLAETVENFRKRLKLKGKNKAVVFVLRLDAGRKFIIAERCP